MAWIAFCIWLCFVVPDTLRAIVLYRRLSPLRARSLRAIVLTGHDATWRLAGETPRFDRDTHRWIPVVRPPLVHGAVVAVSGTVVSPEETPPWELEIRQTREQRFWKETARTHSQHGFVLESEQGRFWVPLDATARVVTGFLVRTSADPNERTIVSAVRPGDRVRVLGTLEIAAPAELIGFRGGQDADAETPRTLGGAVVVVPESLAPDLPVWPEPPCYAYGSTVSLTFALCERAFFYVLAFVGCRSPSPLAGALFAGGLCGVGVLVGWMTEVLWGIPEFGRLALWWTQAAQFYPANMEVELDPLWATVGFREPRPLPPPRKAWHPQ